MKFLFVSLMTILVSQSASAHPVSYKGALGVMTWNQPFLSDHWVTYSFAPYAAVAARAMRMEMPTGEFIISMPQLDYLLKRWNNPDSQANIYLYGGYGGAKLNDVNGSAGQVGIEADAESRSLFILGKWESMRSNLTEDFHHGEFRVGAAPYEAEFNEIASWLMIQVQYHPTLMEKYTVTPLIRLFYKNVLWESGVSIKGAWLMNFMFHF
jgi:hypothetical protein